MTAQRLSAEVAHQQPHARFLLCINHQFTLLFSISCHNGAPLSPWLGCRRGPVRRLWTVPVFGNMTNLPLRIGQEPVDQRYNHHFE